MGSLTHDGARFVFLPSSKRERELAREAGFRCGGAEWYARDLVVAAKLRAFATAKVKRTHFRRLIEVTPWLVPLPLPPAGCSYRKHQPAGARFALERNRAYLHAEPGVGKTIIASIIARARGGKVIYVTPPGLAPNVVAEFGVWAPELAVEVASSKNWPVLLAFNPDVIVVPDSLIGRGSLTENLAWYTTVLARERVTILVDEAHRFKNAETQRTKGLFAMADACEYHTYMSGTPMPNRPIELFALLDFAAPETTGFRNMHRFGVRYCGAFFDGFGWNYKGATNMRELRRALRPFMLKMTKKVLGLPPKTEGVLVVGDRLKGAVAKLDAEAKREYGDKVDKLIESRLAATIGRSKIPMPTYRRLLGLAKVPAAVDHVKRLVEDGAAVLVFAQHIEVVEKLAAALAKLKPYVITGATPTKARKRMVDRFQRRKDRPVFIGNITAMSEGHTLTKATRVVIVEPDWVPGKNTQAGDRAHRIGQEHPVHVDYLVFRNSLDKVVIESVLRKRQAINEL